MLLTYATIYPAIDQLELAIDYVLFAIQDRDCGVIGSRALDYGIERISAAIRVLSDI